MKTDAWRKHANFRSHWWYGATCRYGTGETAVIASTLNATILTFFLFHQLKGWNLFFLIGNASSHREKKTWKTFLEERHIRSMSSPANWKPWMEVEENGPWQGSSPQSRSGISIQRKLESDWWRVLFITNSMPLRLLAVRTHLIRIFWI